MVINNKYGFLKLIFTILFFGFIALGIFINFYLYGLAAISAAILALVIYLEKVNAKKVPENEDFEMLITQIFLYISKKYSIPVSELKILTQYKIHGKYIKFFVKHILIKEEVYNLESSSGKKYIVKITPTVKSKYV